MVMESERYEIPQPRHQGTALAGALLASTGWVGLYLLVNNVLPRAGARWAFFVLLYIAIAGTTIPLSQLVNNRFHSRERPPLPDWIFVRQGVWMGLFVCVSAWLQIPRVLDGTIAFFLALSLIVIEVFLRLRERSLHGF